MRTSPQTYEKSKAFYTSYNTLQEAEKRESARMSLLSSLRYGLFRICLLCCEDLLERDKYDSERLPLLDTKSANVSKDHSITERTEAKGANPRCETLSVPPLHGVYDWGDQKYELPQRGQGVVIFTADCMNDVHVAISPEPETMNPMYELVVGGWSNTKSVVRRKSQGTNLCTIAVGLKKPRLDTVNDLWISIDQSTKLLRMGYGREPSMDSMFLIYKDLRFLSDARYVCFSTWNVAAVYSNIVVLPIRCVP